jgi:hypothetical protein
MERDDLWEAVDNLVNRREELVMKAREGGHGTLPYDKLDRVLRVGNWLGIKSGYMAPFWEAEQLAWEDLKLEQEVAKVLQQFEEQQNTLKYAFLQEINEDRSS